MSRLSVSQLLSIIVYHFVFYCFMLCKHLKNHEGVSFIQNGISMEVIINTTKWKKTACSCIHIQFEAFYFSCFFIEDLLKNDAMLVKAKIATGNRIPHTKIKSLVWLILVPFEFGRTRKQCQKHWYKQKNESCQFVYIIRNHQSSGNKTRK